MRIKQIELTNFRAFPSTFTLSLGEDGKNLSLYGENGTGKSSLYQALKEVFRPSNPTGGWSIFSNIFLGEPHPPVSLSIETTTGQVFKWQEGQPFPTDSILIDASRRAGFLDYRSLLKLSYCQENSNLCELAFTVAVHELVSQFNVSLPGGTERTIAQLWRDVTDHPPASRRRSHLDSAGNYANRFSKALSSVLPQFAKKVEEFLRYFPLHHLTVEFIHGGLSWLKPSKCLHGKELEFRIQFRDKSISNHHEFLNEGRLSALALSMFLAGVYFSNPGVASGSPEPLRLLILDDVLIGLDLNNRLPLLEILEREFSGYQIFLFTYDLVWFEIVRSYTQGRGNWLARKLLGDEVHPNEPMVPRLEGESDELQLATKHLENHDFRAAAVHTRAAFESRLKNLLQKKGVRVPYKRNPRDLTVDILWDAFIKWRSEHCPGIPPDALINRLEAFRSNVLNRLSHSGSSSLTSTELKEAIKTIQDFRRAEIK